MCHPKHAHETIRYSDYKSLYLAASQENLSSRQIIQPDAEAAFRFVDSQHED
jgi:hypothetical protein